jgi:hypothetical protein
VTTGAIAASVVQNAVFDLLNVAGFTALATNGIHTDVPQGTPFPFAWLTFGSPIEDPLDTFGRLGAIVHVELHVYSSYEGDDEALDVLNKGTELTHHSQLTISGWSVPYVDRQPPSLVIEDFNGTAIRHGIAPFDVYATKDN